MRKNILILGHSYYGPQFVEINNQYTALFNPNEYHVSVAYLIGPPNNEIEKKHLADEVIFFNLSRKSIRYLKLRLIQTVFKLCLEKNFEVIICHRYKACYSLLWVAQFCKIPALFFVMHELKTISHFMRKLTIAFLARKNMIFAGVSDAVRNDIRNAIWGVKPEQVVTLHNMADLNSIEAKLYERPEARHKLKLPQDYFIFGNVGRLAINKDQKTLITAFSMIKTSCPTAKLVITGDGPLENELKSYVNQLNLTEDVIFTGYLNDAYQYMKAFDVFILSSIQEAFGMVLLEAMAAKIPIIATRVNGIPEVLGDTGTLISPANPKLLAEKMNTAYNTSHTTRAEIAMKSYERASRFFSIERFKEIFWSLPIMLPFKE